MKLKKFHEGKIAISAPEGRIYDASVFYNSEGELNRDISVSAFQVMQKEFEGKMTICDAMSATGIRGIRYAKEISKVGKVFLNDRSDSSVKLIKKNVKENKVLGKCVVSRDDASMFLRKNIFVAIDLDPFGSPSMFMDSAAKSVYHRGFLAVTATDQSALAGTYPESCFRKYGIKTMKTEFYNELGIRVLISFIISSLARYDKAFVPVMSFTDQHYYRVFGRIERAGRISELLKSFRYVSYCSCGNRDVGIKQKCICGKDFRVFGPVYLGSMSDRKFCHDVLDDIAKRDFRMKKEEMKLLGFLIEEAEMPALYFDLHNIAKATRKNPQKIDDVIRKLLAKGFKVSRTHFSPTAIKTDAKYEEILSCFESQQPLQVS
jgi:tRNA (guanine26-N2/guanine27-N2)-dimethyltransferase